MTRERLIGTWRCGLTGSIYELRPDGLCAVRTATPNGTYEQEAEWEFVDERHWTLRVITPPDPQIPGMEDGAVDVIDYEVASEGPGRMSLVRHDVEFPFVWERVDPPGGG